MEKNLIELFRSENDDDVRLAFLIAKQTNVPIEEVNIAYAILVIPIRPHIAEEFTNYLKGADREVINLNDEFVDSIPGIREYFNKYHRGGKLWTYNFITAWKED